MSPQSIFAFVLLSALAISAPVQAAVIKSTDALCAELAHSSTFYDACVAANLVATSSTIVERANLNFGLTAALCAGLDLKIIGVSAIADACVAAGLLVTTDLNTKPTSAVSAKASTKLSINAFLNAMDGCSSLSSQIYAVVAGSVKLSASSLALLSTDVIVPTLVKVTASLDAAVIASANLARCTDATVEATVLASFNVFASSLNSVLVKLSTSASLYASVKVKASFHSTLTVLRTTLVAYVNHLDGYLSADLARSSVKATLFVSLDTALAATNC